MSLRESSSSNTMCAPNFQLPPSPSEFLAHLDTDRVASASVIETEHFSNINQNENSMGSIFSASQPNHNEAPVTSLVTPQGDVAESPVLTEKPRASSFQEAEAAESTMKNQAEPRRSRRATKVPSRYAESQDLASNTRGNWRNLKPPVSSTPPKIKATISESAPGVESIAQGSKASNLRKRKASLPILDDDDPDARAAVDEVQPRAKRQKSRPAHAIESPQGKAPKAKPAASKGRSKAPQSRKRKTTPVTANVDLEHDMANITANFEDNDYVNEMNSSGPTKNSIKVSEWEGSKSKPALSKRKARPKSTARQSKVSQSRTCESTAPITDEESQLDIEKISSDHEIEREARTETNRQRTTPTKISEAETLASKPNISKKRSKGGDSREAKSSQSKIRKVTRSTAERDSKLDVPTAFQNSQNDASHTKTNFQDQKPILNEILETSQAPGVPGEQYPNPKSTTSEVEPQVDYMAGQSTERSENNRTTGETKKRKATPTADEDIHEHDVSKTTTDPQSDAAGTEPTAKRQKTASPEASKAQKTPELPRNPEINNSHEVHENIAILEVPKSPKDIEDLPSSETSALSELSKNLELSITPKKVEISKIFEDSEVPRYSEISETSKISQYPELPEGSGVSAASENIQISASATPTRVTGSDVKHKDRKGKTVSPGSHKGSKVLKANAAPQIELSDVKGKEKGQKVALPEASTASENPKSPEVKQVARVKNSRAVSKLLTQPESVLAECADPRDTVNLREMLGQPGAWNSLAREEKLELTRMIPGYEELRDWPEDEEIPNYLQEHLRYDSVLGEACADFQRNLGKGYYTEEFLGLASYAMKERIKGTWDDEKDAKMEEYWGQKQEVDFKPAASISGRYSLSDLVKAGCIENGDVWLFERSTRDGRSMKKEATTTSVDRGNGYLTFSYPPGRHETATKARKPSETLKTIGSLSNPTPLLNAMMKEDGRVSATERMSNAWKFVRVFRRGRDLGTLYDIRENHVVKVSK